MQSLYTFAETVGTVLLLVQLYYTYAEVVGSVTIKYRQCSALNVVHCGRSSQCCSVVAVLGIVTLTVKFLLGDKSVNN